MHRTKNAPQFSPVIAEWRCSALERAEERGELWTLTENTSNPPGDSISLGLLLAFTTFESVLGN